MIIDDAPYVTPYVYENDSKKILILVNSSTDDYDEIKIYSPSWDERNTKELNRDGKGFSKTELIRDGNYMILKNGIKSMELKLFICEYRI